jgi:simple sugar transport system ATP-binding protein
MKVSDRCTILRKGKWIATVNTADTDPGKLAEMMVGHHVSFGVDKTPAKPKEDVLTVSGLSVKNPVSKRLSVKDVSFHVRSGEIVTIAGIDGNGQDELVGALTGLEPAEKGTLTLSGHDISKASIRQRIADGMSHIPADRHKYGLVLDFTMEENTVLERYRDPEFRSKGGWIRFRNRHAYAEKIAEKYDVRSAYGVSSSARSMSGGNQQKLIAGRELEKQHSLLVAVQPVRGLDVGAISFLHQQMVKDRDEGKAILVVSLELDEVLSLSDRILVLYGGEIVGEFLPQKTSAEELGLYMAGAKRMTKEEMLAVEKEEA